MLHLIKMEQKTRSRPLMSCLNLWNQHKEQFMRISPVGAIVCASSVAADLRSWKTGISKRNGLTLPEEPIQVLSNGKTSALEREIVASVQPLQQ